MGSGCLYAAFGVFNCVTDFVVEIPTRLHALLYARLAETVSIAPSVLDYQPFISYRLFMADCRTQRQTTPLFRHRYSSHILGRLVGDYVLNDQRHSLVFATMDIGFQAA